MRFVHVMAYESASGSADRSKTETRFPGSTGQLAWSSRVTPDNAVGWVIAVPGRVAAEGIHVRP